MSRVIAGLLLARVANGRKVRTPAVVNLPSIMASRPRQGNAPGNARGLRFATGQSSFRRAATESATENKPPVRADLGGKREEKPRARLFRSAHLARVKRWSKSPPPRQ